MTTLAKSKQQCKCGARSPIQIARAALFRQYMAEERECIVDDDLYWRLKTRFGFSRGEVNQAMDDLVANGHARFDNDSWGLSLVIVNRDSACPTA